VKLSLKDILEKNEGFVFRFITFLEVKESLQDVFGTASNSILYYAAIKAGRRACRRRLEATKNREDALKLLVKDKAEQNWGDITFKKVDWEKRSGRIMVSNSFEARGVRSKEPFCYFFKGYLVGFLSELFQDDVAVSEDRCVAKGDEDCEFDFRREKER